MLHLHFSNRYETLIRRLLDQLDASPGGPFEATHILVPSSAVQRSVTLAIADHAGICANVRFDYLARWLWQQISRVVARVESTSPFAPAVLTWRVFRAFTDAAFTAAHPRLAAYLEAADDVGRYELAQRAARLLEQYATYRDDWLETWAKGRAVDFPVGDGTVALDERWQAALWQRITTELDVDPCHPGKAFADALGRVGRAGALAAGIPAEAHVFVLPAMPPLHIRLLQELGRHTDIHVYVLNPCQEYWFEVIDRRRLSYLAAARAVAHHEEGNQLLASWGRQTQSHVDVLVDSIGDNVTDDSDFAPASQPTLLATIQNSILELRDLAPGSVALADDDHSLEIRECHSLTRELEVLHDYLLSLFAAGSGRRYAPSDILVATPDLDRAALLIDAVFGTMPRARAIPYAVTGRARSTVNLAARTFLELLALIGSRFAAPAVFDLLQQELVARRFALDEDSLASIRQWIEVSGFRWGLDAAQRGEFGVPEEPHRTLADGLDRLFLAYALPSHVAEPALGDLLPAGHVSGNDALTLGGFWRYAEALRALHASTLRPRLPGDWVALLHEATETFLSASDPQLEDLGELQRAIGELGAALTAGGVNEPVSLAIVKAALGELLDDPARGGTPTGKVTFASMASLRNLPFAVVCVIGLNDGAYPTSTQAIEFDLMARQPRRGDRQRRHDERTVFLDLLLAARERLYLSYTARSVRDNSPMPPSVLVAELLDFALPAIAAQPANPESLAAARRRVAIQHPLQPFSADAFNPDSDPRLQSFNAELCAALSHRVGLRSLHEPPATAWADLDSEVKEDSAEGDPTAVFFSRPLPPPTSAWREVTLDQLVEFFRNPSEYLLRRRLELELERPTEELADTEAFAIDSRVEGILARRLMPLLLSGATADTVRRTALAGIESASGAVGMLQLDRALAAINRFAANAARELAPPCLSPHPCVVAVDVDGEHWVVSAGFSDLRAGGIVRAEYASDSPKQLLAAWLHHLLLCSDPPVGVARRTTWLLKNSTLRLRPVDGPRVHLAELVRIYRDGLSAPVHFFPAAAWDYCANGDSLSKAIQTWTATEYRRFTEEVDPAVRLAFRGQPRPLDAEFCRLAKLVFDPLRAHIDADGEAA